MKQVNDIKNVSLNVTKSGQISVTFSNVYLTKIV